MAMLNPADEAGPAGGIVGNVRVVGGGGELTADYPLDLGKAYRILPLGDPEFLAKIMTRRHFNVDGTDRVEYMFQIVNTAAAKAVGD
jgi:hypothetical protein